MIEFQYNLQHSAFTSLDYVVCRVLAIRGTLGWVYALLLVTCLHYAFAGHWFALCSYWSFVSTAFFSGPSSARTVFALAFCLQCFYQSLVRTVFFTG